MIDSIVEGLRVVAPLHYWWELLETYVDMKLFSFYVMYLECLAYWLVADQYEQYACVYTYIASSCGVLEV